MRLNSANKIHNKVIEKVYAEVIYIHFTCINCLNVDRDKMKKYKLYNLFSLWFLLLPSFYVLADESQISSRIVGGDQVSEQSDYPWVVSLKYQSSKQHFCAGTLIDKQWVLTAAHCVIDQTASKIIATVGEYNLSSNPSTTSTNITKIIIHPAFNEKTFNNDIALLKLSETLTQQTVSRLSSLETAQSISVDNIIATAIGWGSTIAYASKGEGQDIPVSYPSILRQVTLPLLSSQSCSSVMPNITDNMICAGDVNNGGLDSCQGDSGGPLLVESATETVQQIGIVSFGQGCAQPQTAGVYTKVSNYQDWIESNITGITALTDTHYFVADIDESNTFEILIQNQSEQSFAPIFSLTNDTLFELESNNCDNLATQATCTLNLTYSPNSGSYNSEDSANIEIETGVSTITNPPILLTAIAMRKVSADAVSLPNNNQIRWYQSNSSPWLVVNDVNYLSSPAINANQQTQFVAIISGQGTLHFDWAVNSEDGYDTLTLLINGVEMDRISGDQQFSSKTYSLSGTTNLVTWQYSKDSSINSGSDKAFIHNIRFQKPGEVDSNDITAPTLVFTNASVSKSSSGGGSLQYWSLFLLLLLACYKQRLFYFQRPQ